MIGYDTDLIDLVDLIDQPGEERANLKPVFLGGFSTEVVKPSQVPQPTCFPKSG